MLTKQDVELREEEIRSRVRVLPDDKRLEFFSLSETRLKDPDTYATLNYLFIAGLHHFYLGKWVRGLTNILIFCVGLALLFTSYINVGIAMLIAITIVELYALFRSQIIIQNYNNDLMETIVLDLNDPAHNE